VPRNRNDPPDGSVGTALTLIWPEAAAFRGSGGGSLGMGDQHNWHARQRLPPTCARTERHGVGPLRRCLCGYITAPAFSDIESDDANRIAVLAREQGCGSPGIKI